jgi:peptidoglycan/LPS O-acetylase OafA/YrhL
MHDKGNEKDTINTDRRRRNNFDLLRLIAALMVVFSHAYVLMQEDGNQIMFDFAGNTYFLSSFGLMIFFIISGYLVCESLFNSQSVKHFVWKRLLRIYPAYIIVTLLTAFVLGPVFTSLSLEDYFSKTKTWQFLVENIFITGSDHILPGVFNGISVNASAWTLALEIRLYLLLLLLFLTGVVQRRWLFTAVYLLFVLIRMMMPADYVKEHFHFDPSAYYQLGMFFLTGSVIYIWKEVIRIGYLPILIAGFLWFVTWWLHMPANMFEVIFFSYLILWIALKLPVLFVPRPDISYGIYIYAWPVQMITLLLLPSLVLWQFNVITIPVIILFGLLSWHFVEKRALAGKNYFSGRSEKRNLFTRTLKA